MKKITAIFLALMMAVVLLPMAKAQTSTQTSGSATSVSDNRVVNIKIGEDFKVDLEFRPSTGYKWMVDYDNSFVKLTEEESKVESDLDGGVGRYIYEFEGIREGKTQVKFYYLASGTNAVGGTPNYVYTVVIAGGDKDEEEDDDDDRTLFTQPSPLPFRDIGTCDAFWTGYKFSEERGCVKLGAPGCSNPFPFQTLEQCRAAAGNGRLEVRTRTENEGDDIRLEQRIKTEEGELRMETRQKAEEIKAEFRDKLGEFQAQRVELINNLQDKAVESKAEFREKIREITGQEGIVVEAVRERKEELRQLTVEKREEARQALRERAEEAQGKIAEYRERLRTDLEEKVPDDRKRETVENIDGQIESLNNRMVTHFTNVVDHIEEVLAKIETRADAAAAAGLDTFAVDAVMENARQAIDSARLAIEEQAGKVYTIVVDDEDTLKDNVGKTRQELGNDLKSVRTEIERARNEVRNVLEALKSVPGVDEADDGDDSDETEGENN